MKNTWTTAVVATLVLGSAFGQACREYSGNCVTCLEDPNCGYCANSGTCVLGSVNGPSVGNCTSWEYLSCSSSTPAPTSPPAAQWWTTFGGSSKRTSFAAQSFSGQITLSELWSVMSVSGGSAAVSTADTTWITASGSLLAFNLATGAVQGNITLGSTSGLTPPTLHKETNSVLVQINGNNEGTTVASYSLSMHTQTWNATASSQWPRLDFGLATTSTHVFAPVGYVTSEIAAIDASSGAVSWTSSGYNADGGCDMWAPTIHGDKQVLWNKETGESNPTEAGGLYTVDGSSLWDIQWNESWQGYSAWWYTVSATNSIVLASPWTPGVVQFTAINVSDNAPLTSTPEIMWSFSCNRTFNTINSMSTDGVTTAYGVCTPDGKIVAVNLKTGVTTTVYSCPQCSAPVIVTNTHIFAISNGCVNAYKIGGSLPVSQVCNSKGDSYNFLSYAPAKQLLIATGYAGLYAISISSASL